MICAASSTSPSSGYSVACSKIKTGSGSRSAASTIPYASGNSRRRQDLDSGNVSVPAFEAVRMLRRHLAASACRHAHHQRHAELPARHVTQGRCVIQNLIHGQHAEIDRS